VTPARTEAEVTDLLRAHGFETTDSPGDRGDSDSEARAGLPERTSGDEGPGMETAPSSALLFHRFNGFTDELAALIAEQRYDERFGDKVFSFSLDALNGKDETRQDSVIEDEDTGEVLLHPRHARRVRRTHDLLGYRAKIHARVRRYGGTCEVCGGPTNGFNGRAKAPKRCIACYHAQRAAQHGTVSKYTGNKYKPGCRCDECRAAMAKYHREWAARKQAS
jgi:uncharacterized protein (DUF1330 family)